MAISRSKRDIGLDLTRIIAFIQVPCIHFLFKIKYYNQAIIGERMYLMTFIRYMRCLLYTSCRADTLRRHRTVYRHSYLRHGAFRQRIFSGASRRAFTLRGGKRSGSAP